MDMFWLIVIVGVVVVGFVVFYFFVDWLARDRGREPRKPIGYAPSRPSGKRASVYIPGYSPPPAPISDDMLREIADAMGATTVADIQSLFDAEGSDFAVEIVESMGLGRQVERAVEQAARTDETWWRPKKEWWEP